jgi:hypothetical protein
VVRAGWLRPDNGPTVRSAGRYFVDSKAAIAALIGVMIGAAVAGCVGDRRWRDASAIGALGTVLVLGVVTEGNHSRLEHDVVFAVMLLLLACGAAARVGMRTRRSDRL